jgi:hypothetical protein
MTDKVFHAKDETHLLIPHESGFYHKALSFCPKLFVFTKGVSAWFFVPADAGMRWPLLVSFYIFF